MAAFAYPVTNVSLPRRRSNPAHIEDRCYGTCNAAFIKGQVSRDWEDFCVTGSAFYDYYNCCLCCVGEDLRGKNSRENAADYLAADFAGILLQCGSYPRVADPCSVPKHDIASQVESDPFPTATVQTIYPPADSLSVGVPITVPLRQLRPGQTPLPTTTPPANQYTQITHTTTAWVATTDAQSRVTSLPSTFVTTTMSMLPSGEQDNAVAAPPPGPSRSKIIGMGAGIGVGCALALLLLTSLLVWLKQRRRRRRIRKERSGGLQPWEESLTTLQTGHATATAHEDGWGAGDKAQLHSESVPTRELDSREIPSPPVELPADEVLPRVAGGGLASVREEELPLEEGVAESDDALVPVHEEAPAEDMSTTKDVLGSSSEEYVLAEEVVPEPDDVFVESREDSPVEEPSNIEDESDSSRGESPLEEPSMAEDASESSSEESPAEQMADTDEASVSREEDVAVNEVSAVEGTSALSEEEALDTEDP